jgi:tetratricopeptide (TPR) repeat protein
MCARALALLALLLAAPARAVPPVDGEYDSPLGRVKVTGDGTSFEGRLVGASKGPYRAGDPVLKATLLDDSLAGQVRVPLYKASTCKQREVWASAVLLVGEGGLSGAVHLPKGCKGPIGKRGGMTFARTGAESPAALAARADTAGDDAAPTPKPPPAKGDRKGARERARALLTDGAAYLSEGNFEQARKRFLDALDEDATVPEAYNGVGVTYRMRNDLGKALGWYKKALAVDPDFGDAYYNMACVYAMQGEKEMALRYLQIAALNGYATADGMDQDPDLEPLRAEKAYQALVRQKM